MATDKTKNIPVREEDLKELEGLYNELQNRSDEARKNGQLFMLQQYIRLLSLISPEISRVQRRFSRESLADFRKSYKDMKLSQGGSEQGSQEA